ncbi:sterol-binding-like protein [Russula emetica]|nr:sterol-binding-like protein [Russula emetica]
MSDVKEEGYKTSEILAALAAVFEGYSAEEKAAQLKKNNGIFEFRVKNAAGKEAFWTIDLKKTGVVKKGDAKSLGFKPDVTIILSDETFVDIADGKTTGQKAFMTGGLKTKGNMMLATKLDDVLKNAKGKAKL